MSQTSFTVPHKQIGVAVIRNQQGKILIDRRLPQGDMAGLWEFPGGKIEPNETIKECIKREIREELGIEIRVGPRLITIAHRYPNFEVTLFVHDCQYLSGEPQPIECEEIRWVTVTEIERYTFPEANTQIIATLQHINQTR
jgi:mutator protein MutT